jgi:hypothetical protein
MWPLLPLRLQNNLQIPDNSHCLDDKGPVFGSRLLTPNEARGHRSVFRSKAIPLQTSAALLILPISLSIWRIFLTYLPSSLCRNPNPGQILTTDFTGNPQM